MSPAHYFLARVNYPRPGGEAGGQSGVDVGYLIYVKPSLTMDEPVELQGHWQANPAFPHDPTSNQFYSEQMVDSYRQLGQHIGETICAEVCGAGRKDMCDSDALEFEETFTRFFIKKAEGTPPPTALSSAEALGPAGDRTQPVSHAAPAAPGQGEPVK
jgi:hypothetical protein